MLSQNSVSLFMPFQPQPWVNKTNIYEVNVRQYTAEGSFRAFAKHLPRLREMGVETVWFMPIHPIGKIKRLGTLGSYYSISDYKTINPEFGTLEDFKELVNQAHEMNLKIIIDCVTNHTAWDHVWTTSNPEFYVKDPEGNFISPYDWEDVIQLDHKNPLQQEAMIDCMQFWIRECDIDGFRCDMAHLTPLGFWEKARVTLDAIKPLFWLAETEDPDYHEVLDASYTWEFLHTMEKYAQGKTNMEGLEQVLIKYERSFPGNSIRIFFTSNHDENSHSGSEYERMQRLAHPFAVFCATWNGIPLIYSGQELPVTKRIPFFNKDEIHWENDIKLHEFYKILLHLHAKHPALKAGDTETKAKRINTSNDENVFVFVRKKDAKEVVVMVNLSPGDLEIEIIDDRVTGIYKNIFSGSEMNLSIEKKFFLKACDFIVLAK